MEKFYFYICEKHSVITVLDFIEKNKLDAKTTVMLAIIFVRSLPSGFTLRSSFCFRNGIFKAKGRRAVSSKARNDELSSSREYTCPNICPLLYLTIGSCFSVHYRVFYDNCRNSRALIG